MEDKGKIYQNRVNKEFHNNKIVFTSYDNNSKSENIIVNTNDIRKKINDINNFNNFIYSKMVNIVIGNDIIKRKIIGIFNNNLVTIDNEYIPIDNINDIYVK